MKRAKLLILTIAIACASCASRGESTNTPRKVKCESVKQMNDAMEHNSFAGKVVAAADANLGFRVAGVVQQASMADGTLVRKGDVVARLDSRDYKLQLAATQAEYDAIKAEVDRIVKLYADQSVSANDYDKATNGLRAITAKLHSHRNALADCELRAPMDGYIVKSNFCCGEAVAAGTPVVSMISAAAPQITIEIPANNYLRQPNFKGATATFDLFGDKEFNLRLKGASPKGNLNQLYKVTFEVEPTTDGQLPAVGMSAMVKVNYTANNQTSVNIPFSAIVERDESSYVWVVDGGHVAARQVEIYKIYNNGECSIRSGLDAGEVVVTSGANSLVEGQEVEILATPAKSNIGRIK